MELRKSNWVAGDTRVSLAVPFAKVDKENRLVSGYATLDNVDTSDDIVTAEASKGAFERFRGNIREMHQPIAAGRIVDFIEKEFFHDGEFFRGIYVTAYVSKGAQDTWEKVLDGTLSGFSIGGNITDQETKFVKDAGPDGKNIRFIKEYDLIELSLVDNPANQLANVFSIVKAADGSQMMKGMTVETVLVNVFWCANDEIANYSEEESFECLNCGGPMEQIGWFERGEDYAEKTAKIVSDFLRPKEDENTVEKQSNVDDEGGVEMGVQEGDNAEVETPEEGVVTDEVVNEVEAEVDEPAETVVEEEAVVEAEVEPDFEKMFDDLKTSVKDSIEKTVETVEQRVADVTKAFDEKSDEFEKSLEELSTKLESIKSDREDVSKRLDVLEKASAVRKSGEVETTESVKKAQKGLWSGTFFDAD